jgi:hypothetical protein
MAKLARALSSVAVLGLTMCHERSAVEPGGKSALRANLDNAPQVHVYRVDFDELNNSGVKAQATLQVIDGNLVVTLDAVGRVPQHVHPQHIHGFTTQVSTCPTAANDTDHDGIISFAEGLPAFGPVQVDLQPYPSPTNSAGATHYHQTFMASQVPFTASDLTQKTMVLHGDFVAGSYVASLPVACGRVQAVN